MTGKDWIQQPFDNIFEKIDHPRLKKIIYYTDKWCTIKHELSMFNTKFKKAKNTYQLERKVLSQKRFTITEIQVMGLFDELVTYFSGDSSNVQSMERLGINTIKMASLLYCTNKMNASWKKWFAYSAFVFWLEKNYAFSLQLVVIAGE